MPNSRASDCSSSRTSFLSPFAQGAIAPSANSSQLLLELPFPAPDDGREDVDALVLRIEHDHVADALERLTGDFLAAVGTVRDADVREEEAQVIVDLRDGPNGRARVGPCRLLLDRDGRRQSIDEIDVRLLHLLEELPRVRGERLDVAPLTFGVDRVERERRLAGPGQARDDDELLSWEVDVDILEVVDARASNGDPVVGHDNRDSAFGSWESGNHVPTRDVVRAW